MYDYAILPVANQKKRAPMTTPEIKPLTNAQFDWLMANEKNKNAQVGFFLNGYPHVMLTNDPVDGEPYFVPAVRGAALGGRFDSFSEARAGAHFIYGNLHKHYLKYGADLMSEEQEKALGIVDGRRLPTHPYNLVTQDLITPDVEQDFALQFTKLKMGSLHEVLQQPLPN